MAFMATQIDLDQFLLPFLKLSPDTALSNSGFLTAYIFLPLYFYLRILNSNSSLANSGSSSNAIFNTSLLSTGLAQLVSIKVRWGYLLSHQSPCSSLGEQPTRMQSGTQINRSTCMTHFFPYTKFLNKSFCLGFSLSKCAPPRKRVVMWWLSLGKLKVSSSFTLSMCACSQTSSHFYVRQEMHSLQYSLTFLAESLGSSQKIPQQVGSFCILFIQQSSPSALFFYKPNGDIELTEYANDGPSAYRRRLWVSALLMALIKIKYNSERMRGIKSHLFYRFSQGSSQPSNMKKFFKQASFIENEKPQHPLHKFIIKLDDRTMRTPYRHLLAVPSPTLAFLVTSEFNRQDKHMKSGQMPLLSLCRTAVDADIEGNIGQHLRHSLVEYLKTDTLNFYDEDHLEQYLRSSRPLVQRFASEFGMTIEPSCTLMPPVVKNPEKFHEWVHSLNNWQLIGMETMTIYFKSTIAAYALAHNYASLETIELASTLEEVMQMKYNGEVDEKMMNLNQVRLMASCGLILFQHGSGKM